MRNDAKTIWSALPWRSRAWLFAKFHMAAAPGWFWVGAGTIGSWCWMWESLSGYEALGGMYWRGPGFFFAFGGVVCSCMGSLIASMWAERALWQGRPKKLGWMWAAAAVSCSLSVGTLARLELPGAQTRVEGAKLAYGIEFARFAESLSEAGKMAEGNWAGTKWAIRAVELSSNGKACMSTCWAFEAAIGEIRRKEGSAGPLGEAKQVLDAGFSASLSMAVSGLVDRSWLLFMGMTPLAYAAIAALARAAEWARGRLPAGAGLGFLIRGLNRASPASMARAMARKLGFAYEAMGRWSDQVVERGLNDSKMLARLEAEELEKVARMPAGDCAESSGKKRL